MLPQIGAAGLALYALMKHNKKKSLAKGLGDTYMNPDFNYVMALPSFDEALQPGYSYFDDQRFPGDDSQTYMRLSPEFHWMEKPIQPHADYTDLQAGPNGSVISDPYYQYEYVYDSSGDYYRDATEFKMISPNMGEQTNPWADQFAGPASNAFSTMIRNAQDKVQNFIRG